MEDVFTDTTFMMQQGTDAKIERLDCLQDFLRLFLESVSLFLEMIRDSGNGINSFLNSHNQDKTRFYSRISPSVSQK